MSSQIGSADTWASFGLPGLVIFALFSVLILFVILVIKFFDKTDKRRADDHTKLIEAHREERKEWKDDSVKQLEKFENALNRLTDGIRNIK